MATDNVQAADPSPVEYAGNSATRIGKRLFAATRPKFFPASVLPVLAGSAWGFSVAGRFDAVVFFLATLATLCVHAGANVLNDVGDDEGGTDRQNDKRIYPYTGGSRFIQTGIMSAANMTRLGVSLLVIAATTGLLLISMKGITVLWFGLVGVGLAVLYSLGPLRLSAIGLGETSVAIAFGVLPVSGAAWLQSGIIDEQLLVFSLPISAWVASILLINEVPDIDADGATGKRTLPVRLGPHRTANLYMSIQIAAAAAVIWLAYVNALPILVPLVPVGLLFLAATARSAIRNGLSDRVAMTKAIEATLAIHTIGSIWLTGAALYLAFWGNS